MDFFGAQDTILWYKNASESVEFKISNNFKQNIGEHIQNNLSSVGKSIPAYLF